MNWIGAVCIFVLKSSFRLAFIHVPSGGYDLMKLVNCFPLDCAEW